MNCPEITTESDAWLDVVHSLSAFESGEELLGLLPDGELLNADLGVTLLNSSGQPVKSPNVRFDISTEKLNPTEGVDDELLDALRFPPDEGALHICSEASSSRHKKAKKRRPSNPVKQNIDRLRDAANEAEAQLALLRARRHQLVGSQRVEIDIAIALEASSVWKDVAARQYRWRRESEILNEKLRKVAHEQAKTIHRLQQLAKRSHAVLKSCTPVSYRPVDVEGTRFARRINELMRITTEMYTHVEHVVLPDMAPSRRALGPDDGVNFQQRAVPCSPHDVGEAVWKYLSQSVGNPESYFRERLECSSDCIVRSFYVRWNSLERSANHRGIIVARRFRRENGLEIIVYTAELEAATPDYSLESILANPDGFRTHGWMIARRSEDASSGLKSEVLTKNVARPLGMSTTGHLKEAFDSFARAKPLVQFSLIRHNERVQRAIDNAFLAVPTTRPEHDFRQVDSHRLS